LSVIDGSSLPDPGRLVRDFLFAEGRVARRLLSGETKEVFETYLEHFLTLVEAGQVVVVDNPGAHKGEGVRDLIEAQGCEVLFLPPYSRTTW
jgi:transposase